MESIPSADSLFTRVADILDQARANTVRAVNHNMVAAYWLIGREIVMVLQQGEQRAGYGEQLLKELSARLTRRFGNGYSQTNLQNFRLFYTAFPNHIQIVPDNIQQTVSVKSETGPLNELSWSHYNDLIRVQDARARSFYESEAAKAGWSVRELRRQIHTLYYERRIAARNSPGNAPAPTLESRPTPGSNSLLETIRDPMILDFLGLPDAASMHESDLESAIIAHLRDFLLELGRGFAFVARQKRLSFEDEHLYVDLVFYSIPLRCYLLIDLKMGKLTHADVGQMDGYVRLFDDRVASDGDNPTIGLILCAQKNAAVARYSVLNDRRQIFASRYVTLLPTEAELAAEVARELQVSS